jgi:hypothetical protein
MQVNRTASASAQPMSLPGQPGDFEVTGAVVVQVAPVVPLSRDDLVAALLLAQLTTEDLAALDDAGVRHEVGLTLATNGLNEIHETVYHERTVSYTAAEARHVALCHKRVASAFGLASSVPAAPVKPRRSRIGDVVATSRRLIVRAA